MMASTINERIRSIVNGLFSGDVSVFGRSIEVKQSILNSILGERKNKRKRPK
jgi:hypothetical protein